MSSIRTKPLAPPERVIDIKDQQLTDASGMPEIRKLGICSTCDHAPSCLFLRASRKPVWFCDEFSDAQAGSAGASRPVISLTTVKELNYSEALELGLCANCEARKACMHRRPGEPVLECEDYS